METKRKRNEAYSKFEIKEMQLGTENRYYFWWLLIVFVRFSLQKIYYEHGVSNGVSTTHSVVHCALNRIDGFSVDSVFIKYDSLFCCGWFVISKKNIFPLVLSIMNVLNANQ